MDQNNQTGKGKRRIVTLLIICLLLAAGMLIHLTSNSDQHTDTSLATTTSAESIDKSLSSSHRATTPSSSDSPSLKARSFEVCGVGRVAMDKNDPTAVDRYLTDITNRATAEWKNYIANDDSIDVRAIGLYLKTDSPKLTDLMIEMFSSGRYLEPKNARKLESEQALDELITLAVATKNKTAQTFANMACYSTTSQLNEQTCKQLVFSDWTKSDPDNALPWVLKAEKAFRIGNDTATTDALDHAARARYYTAYDNIAIDAAESTFPNDMPLIEKHTIIGKLFNYQASWQIDQLHAISEMCSKVAIQNDQRKIACSTLGDLMVNHGNSLLDVAMGESVGKRCGWSKQKIEAIENMKNLLIRTLKSNSIDSLDCESLERENHYAKRVGEIGERRALLELTNQAGNSIP